MDNWHQDATAQEKVLEGWFRIIDRTIGEVEIRGRCFQWSLGNQDMVGCRSLVAALSSEVGAAAEAEH